MTNSIHPIGDVTLVLRDCEGKIKEKQEFHNLVVSTGCELIASRLSDQTIDAPSHMAIGSGTAEPQKSDTALGAELHRNAFSVGASRVGAQVKYKATFGAGEGTGAVTEVGIFNADTAGTMLNRATFAVVNKAPTDSLEITWVLTIN